MRARDAGLLLGLLQVALVGSVGLKLLIDRATLAHGWARTAPYDPSLPIRGRYVRLRLEVPVKGASGAPESEHGVRLASVDGRIVGTIDDTVTRARVRLQRRGGAVVGALDDAVAYFLPEHVPDPSIRPSGEQLWAEVTLPRRGPPRPIRLGIMKDGTITPLLLP